MGKLVLFVVLGAAAVFGARLHSQYDLEERASGYQRALRDRALAAQRGTESTPSEATIVSKAEELAAEYGLQASDIAVSVDENARPTGVGGMAADRLGELDGPANVGASGQVAKGPSLSLKTTLVAVRAHIRAKGFLCSLERDVQASANFGYALK